MAQTDLTRAQGLTASELQSYLPRPAVFYAHLIANIVASEVIKNEVEIRKPTRAENVTMLRLLSREMAEAAIRSRPTTCPKSGSCYAPHGYGIQTAKS